MLWGCYSLKMIDLLRELIVLVNANVSLNLNLMKQHPIPSPDIFQAARHFYAGHCYVTLLNKSVFFFF